MQTPLPDPEFPGSDRLIAALDAAACAGDTVQVTAAVRQALCRLIADPAVRLPGSLRDTVAEHYARRELYRSTRHGYSVVAMTWGPGQGTPVHDHDGVWCVEGVWEGELEVVQYEVLEQDGERLRLRPAGGMYAVRGSSGSLIPPHEYHSIRNPSLTGAAISLHVYGRPLETCSVFEPHRGEWHVRQLRVLACDPD